MKFYLTLILPCLGLLYNCGNTRPAGIMNESKTIYWNLKSPLDLQLPQNAPAETVRAYLTAGPGRLQLKTSVIRIKPDKFMLECLPPEYLPSNTGPFKLELDYMPYDSSGRQSEERLPLIISSNAPALNVIRTSPYIVRGGSAAVLFRADDACPRQAYVESRDGDRFYAQEYGTNGRYLCFFAWPVYSPEPTMKLIAIDKAGNSTTNDLRIPAREKKYQRSKVSLGDTFTKDKLEEVSGGSTNVQGTDKEQYNLLMQGFREKKAIDIIDETTRPLEGRIPTFDWKPFVALAGSRITSGFGNYRYYYIKDRTMKGSYHLGLDLAKVKKSPIRCPNSGIVAFSGYNGANGNMLLIHHGFGVYTLYAHCSRLLVQKGEAVEAGRIVAYTGQTGYATGDHLHFSVILQGRYVDPGEWMSPEWLWENVLNVCQVHSNLR